MIRTLKTIYDFFRLWIMWGNRKEAWQDAKFKNNPKFQKEMDEMDNEFYDKVVKELNQNKRDQTKT